MKHYFTYCLVILLLASCKKEELPVAKHNPGDVLTYAVNLESNYKWQYFYNLETNSIISKNLKTIWDLGFESSAAGFHIILNNSKAMYAWNKGVQSFASISDTTGFFHNKQWDDPSGDLTQTAIGDWRNNNATYIIDRGYNEDGTALGFRKIQFQQVDDKKYKVRIANLDGTGDVTLQLIKDSTYNFQFLSFQTNSLLIVEPPKSTWDLCFTQYTHVFYSPLMTYLVTGCLLNRYQTTAAADSIQTFNAITYDNSKSAVYSNHINTIGYDWKTFSGNTYTTHPEKNYLIKNSKGFTYKLHFIDYYNAQGVKGNPKWEFQKL